MKTPSVGGRLRRLPVFFLLDTSSAMSGLFEVTVQQGMHMVRNELRGYACCLYAVHLSSITFGGTQQIQELMPLQASGLMGAPWQAGGECKLRPAILALAEALTYDLISPGPTRPGDYRPLVFLVLGGQPVDAWQDACASLPTLPGSLQPLVIALVTRPLLAREIRAISTHTLLLKPAEGESMTNFFYWVAQTIITTCESCERGETSIHFPALPYGVTMAA